MLFLTFEQSVYEVTEGAGMINNLVFVQKQDGRASEQILPIQVQLQVGSAIRGQHIVMLNFVQSLVFNENQACSLD